MRCALVMIRELSAWRKISVRRTVGTAPESMRSASTAPGPTDGSWSTSPTTRSAARSGTARSSWFVNTVSIIDASSMTSRSVSRGCSASRLNWKLVGSSSSSRCTVFASTPVVSLRRLAARPVGAASRTETRFARRIRSRLLTSVVFPTPGPPVMMQTLLRTITVTASRWDGESVRWVWASTQGSARSGSMAPQGGGPRSRRCTWAAQPSSARYRGAR